MSPRRQSSWLAALVVLAPTSAGQDWPWWRGPERDGVARSDEWTSEGRELWRREVGTGFSAAAVVGERLWTLGHAREAKEDTLWCLETGTGAVVWTRTFPARRGGFDVHPGGPLAAPAVDAGRLFVLSNEGVLRVLEPDSGALLWTRDVPRELGTKPDEYGIGASPLLLGERVLVCADRLAAFDVRSGELLWKSEPLGAYHSTPMPLLFDGRQQLAAFGDRCTGLIDLASGALGPTYPSQDLHIGGSIATPIVLGEDVLVSAGDGVGMTRIDFHGDAPRVVWHTRAMRNLTAGCVRVGEHLYGFDESILKCLGLDGREVWRERGLGDGSLIAAGDRLLVLTAEGELLVVRASPTGFEELARQKLFEEGDFWSPPVFAHGRVYARSSLGELVALDHRNVRAPRPSAEAGPDSAAATPDARALFARHLELVGGRGRLERLVSMRRTGTFQRRSYGVSGVPIVLEERVPALRREEIGMPRGIKGKVVRAFDGELAWELNPIRGDFVLDEDGQREARDAPGLQAALRGTEGPNEPRTVGLVRFGGQRAWKVATSTESGAERNLYFAFDSGLLLGHAGPAQATVFLADWRAHEGLLVPMLERREERDTGAIEVLRFERVEFDCVPPEAFARPPALAESSEK